MEFLTLAPGSDRIPVELFQILKDDAVKVLHSICNMPGDGSRHRIINHESIRVHALVAQSRLTVAHPASLSMGFSRQEYWSGLLFPSPGDLTDPGIELGSPTSQADSLPSR